MTFKLIDKSERYFNYLTFKNKYLIKDNFEKNKNFERYSSQEKSCLYNDTFLFVRESSFFNGFMLPTEL